VDPTVKFFVYLASVACFALAALGGARRGRAATAEVLVPLGLLLFVLPTLWDAGKAAF
jgi:hypothetical protein